MLLSVPGPTPIGIGRAIAATIIQCRAFSHIPLIRGTASAEVCIQNIAGLPVSDDQTNCGCGGASSSASKTTNPVSMPSDAVVAVEAAVGSSLEIEPWCGMGAIKSGRSARLGSLSSQSRATAACRMNCGHTMYRKNGVISWAFCLLCQGRFAQALQAPCGYVDFEW
jgi:hypothetical protein